MKKIMCGCMLNSQEEIKTPEFLERLTDYEFVFTNTFQKIIENDIGINGWSIEFVQYSIVGEDVIFFADIYINDLGYYNRVANILEANRSKLPYVKFKYFHRGSYEDFSARYQQ